MHRFLSKEMNKEQFVKLAVYSGYGNKAGAEKYVEENHKEEYTTDDFIALHESSMHWTGVSSDLGLRSIYGLSNKPILSLILKILRTASSIVSIETLPSFTACSRFS